MQSAILERIENRILDKHLKEEYICEDCGKAVVPYFINLKGLVFCEECFSLDLDDLTDELVTLANKYTAFRGLRYGDAAEMLRQLIDNS